MQKDNLSKDYLPGFPNITLYQHKKMFRVNTDTSLLGHYLKLNKNDRVLDIGTNNGALLLYASLFDYGYLVGIDINKEALDIAKMNLEENNITNYSLLDIDIKNYTDGFKFDVIIANPPYFNTQNESLKNQNIYLKMARHEEYLVLEDLISGVERNLKKDGTFYLIHTAHRFDEIRNTLKKYNLYIEEYTNVKDENKNKNHVILMKITKNIQSKCNEKNTIIIKR